MTPIGLIHKVSIRRLNSIFTTLAVLGRYISLCLRQIFVASGYLEFTLWSLPWESNPQPLAYRANALPLC